MISSNMLQLKQGFILNASANFYDKQCLLFSRSKFGYAKVMMNINDETREQLALAGRVKEAIASRPRGIKSRIAKKCSVSPQAITGWEKTGTIEKENIAIVSEETGYSLHWLITGRGDKFSLTDNNVSSGHNKTAQELIESRPAEFVNIADRPTIPVLTRDECRHWKDSINNPWTETRMTILSDEIPLTNNTYGFVVSGDFMAGDINDGDRAVIDPCMEPIAGDDVLVELAGDVLIGNLDIVAGDWLLIPHNSKYLTKTLSREQIIGVVVATVPKHKIRRPR